MALYYVRTDGSDANTGTGPATNQAWRTLQKALGATGIGSGDTVYIAPGHYNETVTVGGTYSAETQIIGDPTAAQFSGVSAGYVKHSQFTSSGTLSRNLAQLISSTGKNYLHFKNIYFEMAADNSTIVINIGTARFTKFTSCVFYNNTKPASNSNNDIDIGTTTGGQTANTSINNCIFYGTKYNVLRSGTASGDQTSVTDCAFISTNGEVIQFSNVTASIYNCSIYQALTGFRIANTSTVVMYNCVINQCTTAVNNQGTLTENFNRFIGNTSNVTNTGTYNAGASSTSVGIAGVESGYSLLHNLTNAVMFGSIQGGQNTSFGTASGAPATDLFGVAWSGTSPDAGAITYRNIGAFTAYVPTERNASTITIAPGSTSQSIELYLGATGLTASTTGLSAYYNRTRTASVSITLVARTIAQAWTSGGFAEVDATNMPGVYRLDVPDAALAAGADDVTIVVRGASGTNGAVMTVTLINEPTDAVLVRMGPYQIKADGLGSSQPLDINVGAAQGIDTQVVDANGSGVDITASTLSVKVYDSGGILVATYVGTATYAADGRLTFAITTAVTGTAGTYTATITRTTSASDTQVFGPLRLYVRSV
jgi:hypothetical protein